MSTDRSLHRKIAVMGRSAVGKSSLCLRYSKGQFSPDYNTTIEDTYRKRVSFHGGDYNLEIVDTAGQQEYSMHPNSCVVVDGYLLVYSIEERRSYVSPLSNREHPSSFDVVKAIHDRCHGNMENNHIPTVLVGNKTDLESSRSVSTDEGRKLAELWSARFLETSAKEDTRVEEIFNVMLTEIEVARGIINPRKVVESNNKCVVM